jgi:hypothetical protein
LGERGARRGREQRDRNGRGREFAGDSRHSSLPFFLMVMRANFLEMKFSWLRARN